MQMLSLSSESNPRALYLIISRLKIEHLNPIYAPILMSQLHTLHHPLIMSNGSTSSGDTSVVHHHGLVGVGGRYNIDNNRITGTHNSGIVSHHPYNHQLDIEKVCILSYTILYVRS